MKQRLRIYSSAPVAQTGAALLVIILAVMVGASWLLLAERNVRSPEPSRAMTTQLALNQAKLALLAYAMNYPELRNNQRKGPGFLPCPDRDNDGRPETNCALSTGSTLGRLPFAILGLDDPRDSSGARLWYALAPDFINTRANETVLNSDTPGQLSVDEHDDMVAVILAPGAPTAGQYQRPGNDPQEYLEGANARIADSRFSTTAGNDRLATISRAELARVMEQRVINETRALLERHQAAYSVYPWLAPFADPRADASYLSGLHSGADNAVRLFDKRQDFIKRGIGVNDIVRNLTDGSVSVVTAVSAKSLGLAGHSAGADNDFDKGDSYIIESPGPARARYGVAGAGSKGLVLQDRSKDFRKLGIVPGDVLENLQDGSAGALVTVGKKVLRVAALHGGMQNTFAAGDSYRLRSDTGMAGVASDGLELEDSGADFIALGVRVGDLVKNLSDGSVGRVSAITGPMRLSVAKLEFGRQNRFSAGDVYELPRYNGSRDVRKGLLSVHQPGKHFASSFDVSWQLPVAAGGVVTVHDPGLRAAYLAAAQQTLETTTDPGISVKIDDGQCVWLRVDTVECTGYSASMPYLQGVSESAGAALFVDTAQDFIRAGIKPGDLVGTPYTHVVTGVAAATTLSVLALAAAPSPPQNYRIKLSTRVLNGEALALSETDMQDAEHDFSAAGVLPGDVVENLTDGSFGLINAVAGSRISAELRGGRDNIFRSGDLYRAHYAYADRRRYRFNLRYRGERVTRAERGRRQRDVCRGYGPACVSARAVALDFQDAGATGEAAGPTGLTLHDSAADFIGYRIRPGDTVFNLTDGSVGMVAAVAPHSLVTHLMQGGARDNFAAGDVYQVGKPLVLLEVLRGQQTLTAVAITIPPQGAAGSIRARGIDYYAAVESGDLPRWFIKNRWHQLLYVAYSPGTAGGCATGVDCLMLRNRYNVSNAKAALVISAGPSLPGQARSSGSLVDYYEDDNATLYADDVFGAAELTVDFNDQVAAIEP